VNAFDNRASILILSAILIGLYSDMALANKFQTIGNGVSGSAQIKIEYLKITAYIASGLFFISGLLALATKHKNSHELNYTVWKPSSIIFILLSLIALVIGLLL
jgi:hypothetical protein